MQITKISINKDGVPEVMYCKRVANEAVEEIRHIGSEVDHDLSESLGGLLPIATRLLDLVGAWEEAQVKSVTLEFSEEYSIRLSLKATFPHRLHYTATLNTPLLHYRDFDPQESHAIHTLVEQAIALVKRPSPQLTLGQI
jgi:hypothetical protein